VRWDRHGCLSLTGAAPRSVGVSNRRCSGLTTRGVRADRVGIHPLSKALARAPAREGEAGRASGRPPLTREPSAGGVLASGWGFGLAPHAENDTARVARRDFDPDAAVRGSGDRVVVLADGCGCRSRRAALGPGRKATGLALWLTRSRVRAPGAKRRRKPVRGGESHEHASSETGDRLLVIPRADAQASACSGEGALGDGRRPGSANAGVFDETTAEPVPAARGDGDADAAAMPDP
jgi:hypothetical protein